MDFVFHRSYRGPLQAVVLDWAGTIIDYGCFAPAVVFIEVFKRKGIDVSIAQVRQPMGLHKRDHIESLLKMESVAEQWQRKFGRPYTESDLDELYGDFIPLQLDCLAEYGDLIPGTQEAAWAFRNRGLKIGTSTGYNGEMLQIVIQEAQRRGFVPDSAVSASDVPAGRPQPWMALLNAQILGTYPMEAIVKIGDTVPDIGEGLNAGMWTIGVAMTGNEVGLTESQILHLPADVRKTMRQRAYDTLRQAGAHYVVDSIADVPALLPEIERRLSVGERP